MEFLFKSDAPGEKLRLLAALERFAEKNHLPDAARRAADLAIEEHLTNILTHGFAGTEGREHVIAISVRLEGAELWIEISDEGRAFDPTTYPTPDLSVPAEARKIGGLGIHMIRQSMDGLDYARRNGKNILRMRKGLGLESGL